jgi:hypothetical protein
MGSKATSKEVRKFGLMFTSIFLAIGLYMVFRTEIDLWRVFIGAAILFLMASLYALPVLRPLYIGWMAFAMALAWINTRILLGIVYYLVLTPIGLLMRVFGKDEFGLRFDRSTVSYWIPKEQQPIEKRRYEQLF